MWVKNRRKKTRQVDKQVDNRWTKSDFKIREFAPDNTKKLH